MGSGSTQWVYQVERPGTNFKALQKERRTPMFKLALRYARYALSALATIGFVRHSAN
jgi:hypothetical protein